MKSKYILLLLLLILVGMGGTAGLQGWLGPRLTIQRIPAPVENASEFQISHDGSRIVYRLDCSGQSGLWIANRDGSHPQQIQQETFAGDPPLCPTSVPTPVVGNDWIKSEPFDLANYQPWESYNDPHWSPDDTKLAYNAYPTVYAFPDMEQFINCQSIEPDHLCDGSVIYDLTTSEYLRLDMVSGLSFSLDSQKVAAFRDCQVGFDPKKGCVELSPESATMQLFGNAFGLNVMDLRTKEMVYTDTATMDWNQRFNGKAFRWSPDSQSLCYSTDIHLEKIFSDQNLPHYRNQGKLRVAKLEASNQRIDLDGLACAWAPDSRRIAYALYPSSRFYIAKSGTEYMISLAELRIRDLISGEDQRLFAQEGLEGRNQFNNVEWSPDGRYIAFTFNPLLDEKELEGLPAGDDPKLPWKFMVVEVATGKVLEVDASGTFFWMRWSQDSKKIYLNDPYTSASDSRPYYFEVSVP